MKLDSESQYRFGFGANWREFLRVLDDNRIQEAERSLQEMLNRESLEGLTFLDIGSGSGLFSLAARRLGAKVHSFDYDNNSVACTRELATRYYPGDKDWIIQSGSVLDSEFLKSLPDFNIVYSWGVLHHTGAMWLAINNAISKVSDDGQLFIAIYNDQGWKSRVWWLIKYFYNILPQPLDKFFAYSLGLGMNVLNLLKHALKGDHMKVIKSWLNYDKQRGMSFWHDVVDWYGGFPFEFASYELLHRYFQSSGFILERGEIATSLGCHQMVFKKTNDGL